MRAKKYLKNREKTMFFYDEVERIINDLYDLRLDKEATELYYKEILISDMKFEDWEGKHKEWENITKKYGLGLDEPEYIKNKWEVDKDDAFGIREQLLEVVENDETFGYITFLLSGKKGCVPNQEKIKEAILKEPIDELEMANARILELEQQLIKLNDTNIQNLCDLKQLTEERKAISKVYLSDQFGMKIDYIRIINCLYELGFFRNGNYSGLILQ